MKKIFLTILLGLLFLQVNKAHAADLLSSVTTSAAGAALSCSGIIGKVTDSLTSQLDTTKVPVGDAEANLKEQCSDSISYAVAKTALAVLTQKTVDWINSGFKGNIFLVSGNNR